MKKRIYVMAPFRAKTEMQRQSNIWRAKLMGVELAKLGFAPIVPHVAVAYYHDELPENEMMDICLSLLASCEAGLVVATSEGVRQEIEFATKHGIRYFMSLSDLQERL